MCVPCEGEVGSDNPRIVHIVGCVGEQYGEVLRGDVLRRKRLHRSCCGVSPGIRIGTPYQDMLVASDYGVDLLFEQPYAPLLHRRAYKLGAALIVVVAHHGKDAIGWGRLCQRLEQWLHKLASLLVVAPQHNHVGSESLQCLHRTAQLALLELAFQVEVRGKGYAIPVKSLRHIGRGDVVVAYAAHSRVAQRGARGEGTYCQ